MIGEKLFRLENSNLVCEFPLNLQDLLLSFKTFNGIDQLKANRKNSDLRVDSIEGLENLE